MFHREEDAVTLPFGNLCDLESAVPPVAIQWVRQADIANFPQNGSSTGDIASLPRRLSIRCVACASRSGTSPRIAERTPATRQSLRDGIGVDRVHVYAELAGDFGLDVAAYAAGRALPPPVHNCTSPASRTL